MNKLSYLTILKAFESSLNAMMELNDMRTIAKSEISIHMTKFISNLNYEYNGVFAVDQNKLADFIESEDKIIDYSNVSNDEANKLIDEYIKDIENGK